MLACDFVTIFEYSYKSLNEIHSTSDGAEGILNPITSFILTEYGSNNPPPHPTHPTKELKYAFNANQLLFYN